MTSPTGEQYALCHPVDEPPDGARRLLSCFEVVGFVLVEGHPNARLPPYPILAPLKADAQRLVYAMRGWT